MDNNQIQNSEEKIWEEIEMGKPINSEMISQFEPISSPDIPDAEQIITKGYERLNQLSKPSRKTNIKKSLRHCLIASAAVLIFIITSIFTAAAVERDILESVKIVFEEAVKADYRIIYIKTEGQHSNKTNYNSISNLFDSEMPEYIYPKQLPEGTQNITVAQTNGSDRLFVMKFIDGNGKNWQFTASKTENGKLPMGYKYSIRYGYKKLDFTYTLSRKGNEISKYTVHTVYNGIHYTFYCETSDFEQVETVLKSLELNEQDERAIKDKR